MKYTPLSCQAEGTKFILKNTHCGVLITMGVGKTVSALTAIEELLFNYVLVKRVLVVAPKRVTLITWPDEIGKWRHTKNLTYTVLHGDEKLYRLKHEASKVDITLINYEGLQWLWNNKDIMPNFDMLVLDESTYIKNPSSNRTKLVHKLSRFVKRVVILTGTPKPNGEANLWSQVYVLDRGDRLGRGITKFREQYMLQKAERVWVPKSGARKEILDKIKHLVLVVEDTSGVGLPDVKDNIVSVILPAPVQKLYRKACNDLLFEIDGEKVIINNPQSLTQKLRQIASGFLYTDSGVVKIHDEKLKALDELIEGISGNVLVGINFKQDITLIREHLGYEVPALYSGTSDGQSNKWIRSWMEGKIPVMLVHPAAMSHGLNLQGGGKDIVWYSLTWDLEYYLQLIARLRRRGSKYACIINHIILATGTLDEWLLKSLSSKGKIQEEAIEYLRRSKK
jgi:SNF2 family DNA or RNA helicase